MTRVGYNEIVVPSDVFERLKRLKGSKTWREFFESYKE